MFLYGANCTTEVWDRFDTFFDLSDQLVIGYPHTVTEQANSISDITRWVFETYQNEQPFDFIVGHSMGGLIALELAARYAFTCEKIILIETNLKPAAPFYRNLMTEENMQVLGDQIMGMIKAEAPYYTEALKRSLQTDFDYTDLVRQFSGQLYGIYGDRGVESYADRISDLCLDEAIEERIQFHFVRNTCHMPMVENPEALAAIIKHITALSEQGRN